jgi:glucans biosynthesis protein
MKTHLVFAVMTALLLAFVVSQTQHKTLTFDLIIDQAEQLSQSKYIPTPEVDSKTLRSLNYDQYRDIRWRDDHTLWRDKGLPFQAKFFFTGSTHSKPVTFFQVNRESAGPIRFSPNLFDFGKNSIAAAETEKGGFSGFRVHYPMNRSDYLDEVFVFLGASYFRAVAKDLVWGVSARGVAIDTLKKEEFPDFTSFWLIEPSSGAQDITLYALLDGPSISGAYEFRIWPGQETRMSVRAVLFPRRDIPGIGLAPLTSMFWFGENSSNTFGDFRPEVHDSDGLQIERGNGEWVWRPLSWSKNLQVSIFEDENPKGFGLLQRDRDFSHYQDMEARYHQRPSVWVKPAGAWGKGTVQLIQLPTNNEYMDNVVAYWQPEGGLKKGTRTDISYALHWFAENAAIPPLGRCLATRIDSQDTPYYRVIVLDFAGGELDRLPDDAPVTADVWIGDSGAISNVQVVKNSFNKSWRVSFVASANQTKKPIELRCSLRLDNRPITETWTMTWIN